MNQGEFRMKKNLKWVLLAVLAFVFVIAGCTNNTEENNGATEEGTQETQTLTVGAVPVPHAEILKFVAPALKEKGYELKIVEYSDYVQPNLALTDGSLDANFFQHIPYMEQFAKDRNLQLTWTTKVHIEPMGLYSKKLKDVSEVEDGAQVSIPNDATNGGRALLLLEKAGLLKLKEDAGISATVRDIVENPKNLKIVEMEAPILPRSLDSVALAVINTNYALEADMSPVDDALVIEDGDSPYANVITVRTGDEANEAIQALNDVLTTEEVKNFIHEKYQGAILPVF